MQQTMLSFRGNERLIEQIAEILGWIHHLTKTPGEQTITIRVKFVPNDNGFSIEDDDGLPLYKPGSTPSRGVVMHDAEGNVTYLVG